MNLIPSPEDIVVVGGGSAGCALAGRIVEAGFRVTLIEAGPDYGPLASSRWPSDLLDAKAIPSSHGWGTKVQEIVGIA